MEQEKEKNEASNGNAAFCKALTVLHIIMAVITFIGGFAIAQNEPNIAYVIGGFLSAVLFLTFAAVTMTCGRIMSKH